MRLMFVSDEQCLVEHFFRVLRTSCDVCHLTDLVNFMSNLSATELMFSSDSYSSFTCLTNTFVQ